MAEALKPLTESTDFAFQAHKKKGCSALVEFARSEEIHDIFLGGVGIAAFASDENTLLGSLDQALQNDTLGMEWVYNRLHGQHKAMGAITADFSGSPTGDRSRIFIISENKENDLFPATMVNSIFFRLNLVDKGMELFNKDPMILRATSAPLATPKMIKAMPQYQRHPKALPSAHRATMSGGRSHFFTVMGKHRLKSPVLLYPTSSPNTPIARMIRAEVTSGPSFGLELEVVKSTADESGYQLEVKIRNLTSAHHEIRWHAGEFGNFEVVSTRTEQAKLAPAGGAHAECTVTLQARQKVAKTTPGRMDAIFVSAASVATSYQELICGSLVLTAT